MIPQEKSAAVTRGLREAFGVETFDDIRVVTGGNSTTRVYRIVVQGTPYLMKVIMRTDDPTRHFACMRAAADAGIAPPVRYTRVEDKLLITDFVNTQPLPIDQALIRVPALLRDLHALRPFAGAPAHINTTCTFLLHDGPARDGFLERVRSGKLLPEPEMQQALDWHRQAAALYSNLQPDMASCHNDLFKPDNILFDGQRAWLVDWEAAFFNDRYADLAVAANLVVTNEQEEAVYLREYFGRPATDHERARFFLMQQIGHIFYTLGFLLLGSGAPLEAGTKLPSFPEYHRLLWARAIDWSDKRNKTLHGLVHHARLLENMRQPRWKETVEILSARHACP